MAAAAPEGRVKFIEAGDKICKASNDRLLAQVKKYETHDVAKASGAGSKKTKVAKPEQVEEFLRTVALKEVTEELRLLRFLKPPSADVEVVNKMLTGAEAALAKAAKDPKSAAHDNPFAKVSKEFVAYGFTVCGKKINRVDPK